MAFEGAYLLNLHFLCFFLGKVFMNTTAAVQWNICVQCCRRHCTVEYANNVKCMHTGVPGHTVDCREFK